MRKGILVCFSTNLEGFKEKKERVRFFKLLYGWNQRVIKEGKTYVYRRDGLLDSLPHIKIDQSSFIVPEDEFERIINFFNEWSKKVIWRTFKILLEEEDWKELFECERWLRKLD